MNRIITLLLIGACVFGAASEATAAKKGFYLGIGPAYNTINGDFNGDSGLSGGNEIIVLPKIDNAPGIDFLAGFRFHDRWAVEFDLIASSHNGTWQGLSRDVDYIGFSVNGKYFLSQSQTTQPYLLLGISINDLVIKHGAENTMTLETGDARLTGSGINFGVGVEHSFGRRVTLSGSLLYRYISYDYAEGINQSGEINHNINGSGFTLMVTPAFHF